MSRKALYCLLLNFSILIPLKLALESSIFIVGQVYYINLQICRKRVKTKKRSRYLCSLGLIPAVVWEHQTVEGQTKYLVLTCNAICSLLYFTALLFQQRTVCTFNPLCKFTVKSESHSFSVVQVKMGLCWWRLNSVLVEFFAVLKTLQVIEITSCSLKCIGIGNGNVCS